MPATRDWRDCRRDHPCPVCGHTDWCSYTLDGRAAHCRRVESAHQLPAGGWLHKLTTLPQDGLSRPKPRPAPQVAPAVNVASLAGQFRAAVSPDRLRLLANSLRVAPDQLDRLEPGWDGQAWTFPMRGESGEVVGIRRRLPSGRKLAVKGGHEGCFMPAAWLSAPDPLLICEGPTDTAAALTLGYGAVGRPSCTGGTEILLKWTWRRDVVIMADYDEPKADGKRPGQAGALRLAAELAGCPGRTVKVIYPQEGKDIREWLALGATRDDVDQLISLAMPR